MSNVLTTTYISTWSYQKKLESIDAFSFLRTSSALVRVEKGKPLKILSPSVVARTIRDENCELLSTNSNRSCLG